MVNKYYQKSKEKLEKEAREIYQNTSEEEKEKRQKKARDRWKSLSDKEKKESVSIIVMALRIFPRKKNKKKSSKWEIIISI